MTDDPSPQRLEQALAALADSDLPLLRRAECFSVLASTESYDLVDRAVQGLTELRNDPAARRDRKSLKYLLIGARKQLRMLDRYGRDPALNEAHGRESTGPELSFLASARFIRKLRMPLAPRRLRVLVLHGFRQSATGLNKRTRALQRALEHLVEFVFLDGPASVDETHPTQRRWWKASDAGDVYEGWEDAVRLIDAHLPVDGIIGFSQGSSLAGLLASLRSDKLRFAICVSGFPSQATAHRMLTMPRSIHVPSVHIFGEKDTMVPPPRTLALAGCFVDPIITSHPGGHFAPDKLPFEVLRTFLEPFVEASLPLSKLDWDPSLSLDEVRTQLAFVEDLPALLRETRRAYPGRLPRADEFDGPRSDDVAYHIWLAAWERAPELVNGMIADDTDFRSLSWLALRAHQELADADGLVARIASRFAEQLVSDKASGAVSPAAEAAPRTGSALDDRCGLGRRIAQTLSPDLPHSIAYARYRRTVVVLSKPGRALRRRVHGFADPTPPSQEVPPEVVRPRPVPVVPCPLDELDPLLGFLESKREPIAPSAFPRGTVMPDGRLDLCKQVVGPAGIGPLLTALDGNPHVDRLLLGNNVVGAGGAHKIAGFIASAESHVKVWYLAGNELDAQSVRPICEALADAREVEGLWLKRNPLGPAAAAPLGELLRGNETLLTLDLVNTGMLDDGAVGVCEALLHNTALKHLYLGTNGIGPASASAVAALLAHDQLESLYVDCNRLGDEGVAVLAEGLAANTKLKRLSLASNRIGPEGMRALAVVLAVHPSLTFVNLGWTRATSDVGEAGNTLGDEGAAVLGELLAGDPVLRALDISRNRIGPDGLDAVCEGLATNTQLVELRHAQHGMPTRADSIARMRGRVAANRRSSGLDDVAVEAIRTPGPTQDVLSVYRTAPMGG